MTPKENQKSASDFDALEPRKRGCSPLLTPKQRAAPEKTEESRLFGVKIFEPFFPAPPICSPSVAARQLPPGEQARPQTFRLSQKLSRYAKGSLPEGAVKTVRF